MRRRCKSRARVLVKPRSRSELFNVQQYSTNTNHGSHRITAGSPVSSSSPVVLPASSTLKVLLTAQDGKTGKKPHQAFLTLQETENGLEESFAFSVKDNGKAKVDVVCIQQHITMQQRVCLSGVYEANDMRCSRQRTCHSNSSRAPSL